MWISGLAGGAVFNRLLTIDAVDCSTIVYEHAYAYSDYDYNDFDSEIPYLLNQCKSRNNRKNAGKSLMKNIESMPKFEHFPMRSGQLLSSGLESRLSDLGRAHHMFSRILKLWIYDIFFTKFYLFCFFPWGRSFYWDQNGLTKCQYKWIFSYKIVYFVAI